MLQLLAWLFVLLWALPLILGMTLIGEVVRFTVYDGMALILLVLLAVSKAAEATHNILESL